MNLTLKIWRQKDSKTKGQMVDYKVTDISEHMSFLEMMDVLNEQLFAQGEEPVAFDHDCREGICGMCSMYINGEAHGQIEALQPVNYTCVCLTMATLLLLSHLEQLHSL